MPIRNWWHLHAQCEHDHKHRRTPLPVLTRTHAVFMMQDAGALMAAARQLDTAISRKDDAEETKLRVHIQSLALSLLHLVNDKEDNTSVKHPGFDAEELRSAAASEGHAAEPSKDGERP